MTRILRYAAFAEEATYNVTPIATPPVFYADIASASLDTPTETELVYEGGMSRGMRLHRPGFYAPAGNVVYADSVDTMHRALRWALGSYVFTGDSPLNTHECYASEFIDQEQGFPSFAVLVGKDVFEHRFRGCVCNSFQLVVEDSFAEVTLDIVGAQDEKDDLDEDAIDKLAATPPFVFHEVNTSIEGSDDSAIVRALTFTIENGAEIEAGRSLGSRHPRRAPVGNRVVNLEMTMWYENTDQIERVWGGATGPVQGGSPEQPVVVTLDAGGAGSVELRMPRMLWTGVSTQPSGQARIEQTVSAQAFLDDIVLADALTTVRTEVLATIMNDQGDITA